MIRHPHIKAKGRSRGLTLAEVVVTSALLSVMMVGLTALNTTCRGFVRAQRETALASYALEQASENIRVRNWAQITTPATLRTWLEGYSCDAMSQLPQPRLRVSVSPYPPLEPEPTPLVLERAADGTCTIVSQPAAGFSLKALLAVRVDMLFTWNSGNGNRERTRELSSVISLAGMLK